MPTLRSFRASQTVKSDLKWDALLSITVWLILALALALGYQDRLYSTSIDFAAHGTLVSKLMASWSLSESDVSLAEMATYPRVAHQIASIAGHLTGSAIKSMQETAIISLFLLWSMVGLGFSGLSRNRLFAALATLTAIIVFGHLQFGIEFFGSELIASYFFAQLVAQALGMAILVFAMRTEWKDPNSIMPVVILAICSPLLASVHLLPALELLGALAILASLQALKPSPGKWIARTLTSAGIFLASAALLAANPDFLAMVQISSNNGATAFRYVANINEVMLLATVTAVVCCFMLSQWWRKRNASCSYQTLLLKYFGAFGLATAGLCLTQIFVLQFFARGSEYACLKYAVALQSQLAIAAALLVTLCIRESRGPFRPGVSQLAGILFAVAACVCNFWGPVPARLEPLVAAEINARQLERSQPGSTTGKYDLVMGIDAVPPIGSYFISRGVLGSPSFGISMDVLFERLPSPGEQVNRILTSEGSDPWDIAACRQGRAGALVVLDGACVYSNFHALQCRDTIEFKSQGSLDKASSGFSNPEPTGRWSEGPTASLTCEQVVPAPTVVYLDAAALVSETHSQRMTVSVNSGIAQTVEFSTQTPARTIEIPLPIGNAPRLVLRFEFPDAASPAELGINADQRKLAVFMYRLRFE